MNFLLSFFPPFVEVALQFFVAFWLNFAQKQIIDHIIERNQCGLVNVQKIQWPQKGPVQKKASSIGVGFAFLQFLTLYYPILCVYGWGWGDNKHSMLDLIKFVEAQPPLKDLRLHPWTCILSLCFSFPPWMGVFVQWSLPGFDQLGDVQRSISVSLSYQTMCANAYHAHTCKPLSLNADKYGNMVELWHAGYRYR